MGTYVIYNGVRIHNVLTQVWDQQVVYDPSGTDLILHRFRLRFQGHIHVQPMPEDIADAPTYTAIDGRATRENIILTYEEVRRLLVVPRKTLEVHLGESVYTGNSDVLLRVVPPLNNKADRDVDVDNGPKPKLLDIQHIVADKIFRVVWEVECAKVDTDTTAPVSEVLNNRWSVEERMDDNFVVTRTIRGQIRLAFGNAKDQDVVPAHNYKTIVVPPLEDGFRREAIDFATTPDGLSADYVVTDKQTDTAAPWPATKINVSHSERSLIGDQLGFYSDINISLQGPPGCDRYAMMLQALRIADIKIGITNVLAYGGNTKAIPLEAAMVDSFGQIPRVELRILAQRTPGKDETVPAYAALLRGQLCKPLVLPALAKHSYSKNKSPIPPLFGYAGTQARSPAALFVLHCFLQNSDDLPNDKAVGTAVQQGEKYTESVRVPTKIRSAVVNELPPAPLSPAVSKGHQENIYTFARMQSRYYFDAIRVQLPIARAVSGTPTYTGESGVDASIGGTTDDSEDTCSIFTLARKQCYRLIVIDAERGGMWPMIPKPKDTYEDGDLKGTLLKFRVLPMPPTYSASGQFKIFRVKAVYKYALNRPPKDDEKMRVGSLPFTSYAQSDNLFAPSEAYSEDIGP